MSENRCCPECGAAIPEHAPGGLCPACMLKVGLGSVPSSGPESQAQPPTVFAPSPASGFIPPAVEEIQSRLPQFEILELLGRGGMGAVYKARQKHLDRLVAVKILPPEVSHDPDFAERFVREARALARLNHPHIVGVFDFGETDELFYFVMEYVDGANLRQAMQAGQLSAAEALAIVPQICEALQFAHDEGVVHRDIKPENILLDKRGRVKIADFGLSKLLREDHSDVSLTGTHQVMGTLRYMAPEQMQGTKSVDHRADIYSLGVVFYELLTGEVPVGRFEPPSQRVEVDVRLDEVVLRALEREPDKRWQRASEVKTEVESISSSPRATGGKVESFSASRRDELERKVVSLWPNKHAAIAAYQRVTGVGLAEAVRAVDVISAMHGLRDPFRERRNRLGIEAVICLGIIGALWWLNERTLAENVRRLLTIGIPLAGLAGLILFRLAWRQADAARDVSTGAHREAGSPEETALLASLSQSVWFRALLLLVVAGLYTSSFFQDACRNRLTTTEGGVFSADRYATGWECFRDAWNFNEPCWYANPALWVGSVLLARGRWRGAAAWGGLAVALALSVQLQMPLNVFHRGYWWWTCSMLVVAGSGVSGWWRFDGDGLRKQWAKLIGELPTNGATSAVATSPQQSILIPMLLLGAAVLGMGFAVAMTVPSVVQEAYALTIFWGIALLCSTGWLLRRATRAAGEELCESFRYRAWTVTIVLIAHGISYLAAVERRSFLFGDLLLFWPACLLLVLGHWRWATACGTAAVMLAIHKHNPFSASSSLLQSLWGVSLLLVPVVSIVGWFRHAEAGGWRGNMGLSPDGRKWTCSEWWLAQAESTKSSLKWFLNIVYLVCLVLFFSFTVGSDGQEAVLKMGQPTPWLVCRQGANGTHYGVQVLSWSYLAAALGLNALFLRRKLESFDRRTCSPWWWHGVLWAGCLGLGLSIGLGHLSTLVEATKVATSEQTPQPSTQAMPGPLLKIVFLVGVLGGIGWLASRRVVGRWAAVGLVFLVTTIALIWHNVQYLNVAPPESLPAFVALYIFLALNAGLVIWASSVSLRDWLRTELEPQRRIRPPAIAMIVVGSLGILECVAFLIQTLLVIIWKSADWNSHQLLFIYVFAAGAVMLLASRVVSVVAGVRLWKFRGRGMGLVSSILLLLPTDPVAFVAVPIGIWSLLVLLRDDVAKAIHAAEDVARAGTSRTWTELWQKVPAVLRLAVHVALVFVYFSCVISFFGYAVSSSTVPGKPDAAAHRFTMGLSSPWFEHVTSGTGFHWSVHLLSLSTLVAFLGLAALGCFRKLEEIDRGRVHSIWWHYGLWIFMLLLAAAVGIFSSVIHARKVADQAALSEAFLEAVPARSLDDDTSAGAAGIWRR